GAHHALQVLDDALVETVGVRPREVRRDLTVTRRERGNLRARQRADAGALHARRQGPKRLPPLALLGEEPFRGHGGPSGGPGAGAGAGARRKPAAPFLL